MRIGFFTDGFLPQPNGVATSVFETARELESRGHEVFIIAPKYPGYIDRDLNVIRLPSLKIAEKPETRIGISLPDQHLRKIISMDFDIIHGHSGGPVTLLGWEIARAKSIPCVVTYHTLWNRYTHYFLKGKVVTPKMMEQATKIFGNQVDFLIAPTERVEKELKKYGVKKPIRIVPSGINLDKFKAESHGFLRKKLKLSKDDPILLFVGRLGPEKNVDFLLKSFVKVFEEDASAHLVIVGDGPERKKLEALAKKLNVKANTHFTGEIESGKMHKIYPEATVFVFSSTTETQGLVVPEALASGVPVVAINDPAYEIVKDGENGFLVANNEKQFASKILSLTKDENLRKKMSENASESIDKLSVKSTVDLLEGVYSELLEKHNKKNVARIMANKERVEALFVASVVYWIAVLATRLIVYLTHTSVFYPRFNILDQPFYHSSIGLFLILLYFALFVKKRSVSLVQLVLLGAGCAFIADDILSTLLGHVGVLDYWNPLNLAIILVVGLVPLFFMKSNGARPRFYIDTKVIKHVNPKNPKVSVVIPAYNEGKFIEPTLKSLLNQTHKDFELIVVDNASTDDTAIIAESFGARVVVQKIKGVAAARQKGFESARGEIIASTDADSIVPANWVAKIAERYEKDSRLAGFGGLANLYSGALTATAAGRYLFPIFWQIDKMVSGGWNMSGFNMSVRKSAFKKIGGFDTNLKMGEDIDLSKKLRTVGRVKIDMNLFVFSSGRRYATGIMSGLSIYAPWWISKVILKRDKPFEFPAVRSEKGNSSNYDLLPLSLVIMALSLLFFLGNAEY